MKLPSKAQVTAFLSGVDRQRLLQTITVFSVFIVPLIILYLLDPGSFEFRWKGRAPYLLFLWLFALETGLAWRKLKTMEKTQNSAARRNQQ